MDWLTVAKIVGPSVGFLLVIYWQHLEKKEFSNRLFDAITILGKHTNILEKMEKRILRGD